MRLFNSFQITLLLACWPFIIGWLKTNPFQYSNSLFWIAVIAYVVHFGINVGCVHEGLPKD